MPDFAEPIQQGSAHAWPFVPSAILLGALHGLEPGHSKTMMAAFSLPSAGRLPKPPFLGLPPRSRTWRSFGDRVRRHVHLAKHPWLAGSFSPSRYSE